MNVKLSFFFVSIAAFILGLFLKGAVGMGPNWLNALCALLALVFLGVFSSSLCRQAKYARLAPFAAVSVVGSLAAMIGFCMGAA